MRETAIQIRVSSEEKERLQEKSEGWAEPLSAFIRARALEAPVTPTTDPEVPPKRFETELEKQNKALVRKAVENEEPYEVEVQVGTPATRAAYAQARKEWDEAHA